MARLLLYSTIFIVVIIISNLSLCVPPKTASLIGNFDIANAQNKIDNGPEYLGVNNGLEISTNKNTFEPGETINITVKNNGAQPLTFPDAALGLMIINVETKESFSFIAAQVLTLLRPGESKSIEWDQRGLDGIQVKQGEYRVSVKTIPDQKLSANSVYSQFQIKEKK
jgi:archaellum component FlaG (FlaF/FlaG flagellin family)